MKVAILAPEFMPTWGGVGIYTIELVKELSKYKDLEVHVITPKRLPKTVLKNHFNNITFHYISEAKDTFFYNYKFQYGLLRKFPELHKRIQFDLVHSMNTVHMPDVFLKLFTDLKIPTLCTIHTTFNGQVKGFLTSNKNIFKMAPSEKMSILLYPVILTLEKLYTNRVDYFTTVSNKYQKEGIEVIHNGINTDIYNYQKIINPYKDYPQLKGKKDIVLYVGRLITQKGIDLFIRLMKDVDAHFVIAGSGNKKLFCDLIQEHDITEDKYTFLGKIPNHNLPSLYKLSKVFVLPSYYENFPISLLEAMSMKCACVGTNVGAVDEIITDNETGFIIEAGNYSQLKNKTRELLKDTKLRNKIRNKAYHNVTKNFTTKILGKKTYKYYKKILGK